VHDWFDFPFELYKIILYSIDIDKTPSSIILRTNSLFLRFLTQDYNFPLRSFIIIFVGFNIIMESFSLKEIYNPNSIFTQNFSLYVSSIIPVCFQILRYFEIPTPSPQKKMLSLQKA
jgi:hypothetical protein